MEPFFFVANLGYNQSFAGTENISAMWNCWKEVPYMPRACWWYHCGGFSRATSFSWFDIYFSLLSRVYLLRLVKVLKLSFGRAHLGKYLVEVANTNVWSWSSKRVFGSWCLDMSFAWKKIEVLWVETIILLEILLNPVFQLQNSLFQFEV